MPGEAAPVEVTGSASSSAEFDCTSGMLIGFEASGEEVAMVVAQDARVASLEPLKRSLNLKRRRGRGTAVALISPQCHPFSARVTLYVRDSQ
jgi:hypothetical protein